MKLVSSTSGLDIGRDSSTGLDAVVAQGSPSLPVQQDEHILENPSIYNCQLPHILEPNFYLKDFGSPQAHPLEYRVEILVSYHLITFLANLDELVLDHKEAFLEKGTSDDADSGEGYPEEDLEEVEIISVEDMKERNTKTLRNKVLDRLAEY
ncbi:hypothetical protein B7494_g5220 [Chlorociboria aeruginascens]|nr:hypothetical protein B7494_g5220 [Chlorociboria aeruginascens]